jgi:hypothetical protein
VFVGKRLELLLLDEAALGGLLEQALGRREVVQVNRFAQWNPSSRSSRSQMGRLDAAFVASAAEINPRCAGGPPRVIERLTRLVHSQTSDFCDFCDFLTGMNAA